MINYSMWVFNKFNNLHEFMNCVVHNRITHKVSGNNRGNLPLKHELQDIIGFELTKTYSTEINGQTINYILFNANVQRCTRNNEKDIFEVLDQKEDVIAFEKDNKVRVIIMASQKRANRIISQVFKNIEIWGEALSDDYINEDILYWLFYRLRERQKEMILNTPKMYLKGIRSYLGRTDDKINAVRGNGIRVSALLGTLGMLLGEENLRALRPIIEYGEHEIDIEIYIGNTGKLYERTYIGDIYDESDSEEKKRVNLILLVCGYILPGLKKGYDEDCKRNDWSIRIKQTFLRAIGNEMMGKVESELTRIDKEIKKMVDDTDFESDDTEISDVEEELFSFEEELDF